jgi:hypothetical protein
MGHIACLVLLAALPLAACATADPVNFANGQPGYAISCDWGLNGLAQCYRKAGSICTEHGYALRDWQGRPISFNAVEQNADANFGSAAAKTILVQCAP